MTGNFDLDTDLGLNGLGAVAATDKITARRSGVTGTVTASGLATYVSSVQATSYTVATLPSAATSGAGARAFVTDSNATTTAGIGATVAGGGANFCPVYSDGTNWKIG